MREAPARTAQRSLADAARRFAKVSAFAERTTVSATDEYDACCADRAEGLLDAPVFSGVEGQDDHAPARPQA